MQKKYFWKNTILLFVGVALLLLSTITVSAITVTDGTDDVADAKNNTFVSRPNIDIITVTYELNGDIVTLTMTVKGDIVTSAYITYTIYWTDGDLLSGYAAQYRDGNGYVMKGSGSVDSEYSISPENTITFTFTRLDSTGFTGVVGSAMEYAEDYSNTWIDNAPDDLQWDGNDETDDETDESGDDETEDDENPVNGDETVTTGNGDDGGGTPGFELLAFIVAVAVALIILRRKK